MICLDKKSILSVFALACLGLGALYSYGEEGKSSREISLFLQDAVTLAFKNNKDIRIQEEEIKIAKAGIQEAQSAFLPQVNINAGYTHYGSYPNFGATTLANKDGGVFFGYKNDNKLGIGLDQSIYNGGASIANFKQASLGLNVSEETMRAKKLEMEFEIKRLYYGLLLAYETERIAQELVDQAEVHYEDVKKKFEQGTSSKFDLLQSKVQISKLTPELVKAENAVDLIAADLKKTLGLKMQDPLILRDKLSYSLAEISEEAFLKQAYMNNPGMKLKALGIDINKWAIQMAKSGWRPYINAALGYTYRSGNLANMFNDAHNNWNAGFTVTIPLFDGFSTKAKVDQAASRYTQARIDKEDLVAQIAVDVRQACLDLKQGASIIDSSKDNIEEAREVLKIAEVSYDNGVGTNLDVLDAQVSLSQIEKNLAEGTYDYLMARASLDRAMGQSCVSEAQINGN